MDNPYLTTYPQLMSGKTVMYVHGFGSSASTNTVRLLQTFMPSARVVADDLPLDPSEAIAMLRAMAEREHPSLIIGTSMGGMMTEQLYGYDRILVNPAFCMADTMAEHGMMGKQTFQNPRKDGIQEFIVTKALVKQYRELTEQNFLSVSAEEQQRVWGLFGDNDPVVNTFSLFEQHYPQALHFHGEHRLTEHVVHRYLLPLIRRIDDRQEARQRNTVYIHARTLRDSYGHPKSSLQKAFDMLIAHYDVQIVAPSPTNHPELMAADRDFVEQTFSAPAWGKLVFTNTPHLLLGDYLIDTMAHPDFMGTHIVFGSDTFKTWEEVITFFERLGGQ